MKVSEVECNNFVDSVLRDTCFSSLWPCVSVLKVVNNSGGEHFLTGGHSDTSDLAKTHRRF